jgi:1-acyl-sn-glycerol-3-phosphate acyltransferase
VHTAHPHVKVHSISRKMKSYGSRVYLSPPTRYALLRPRKGFIRLALKHGLPLVPVYIFGNTKLFKRLELPKWIETLSLVLRTSIVLFWGRLGLPVPFQVPLYLHLFAVGGFQQV